MLLRERVLYTLLLLLFTQFPFTELFLDQALEGVDSIGLSDAVSTKTNHLPQPVIYVICVKYQSAAHYTR